MILNMVKMMILDGDDFDSDFDDDCDFVILMNDGGDDDNGDDLLGSGAQTMISRPSGPCSLSRAL